LAEELGGNYVTIIKVLHDLEQEGYVECRNGVGCFVKYLSADKPALHKKVQMVVDKVTYDAGQEDVLAAVEMGRKQFEARGWEYDVCPVSLKNHELQRTINNPEAYSVVYGIQPYLSKVDANFAYVRSRLVLIGEFANGYGIATIIADEYMMMRLALEHLREQGYDNTAIVLCSMRSPVEQIFTEAWVGINMHYGKSLQWCNEHCISLQLESSDDYDQSEANKQRLVERRFDGVGLEDIDSFICPGTYWGCKVGNFLKGRGLRIPEDVGLVCICDGREAMTFEPPLTCLDNHLDEHIAFAVEILENRFAGHEEFAVQYCGTPSLVIRGSTNRKGSRGRRTKKSL